jgi:hypothetical protein
MAAAASLAMATSLVYELRSTGQVLVNFARFVAKNAFTFRTFASCVSRRCVMAK